MRFRRFLAHAGRGGSNQPHNSIGLSQGPVDLIVLVDILRQQE
jgi:hypothetical protein